MKYLLGIFCTLIHFSSFAQWVELTSGTTVDLKGIRFVDENNGYCIGTDGIFLKTTDGGNNWTKKVFFTAENFEYLHFIDSTIGFIASKNHIYKTSDGGLNFTEITYLLQHPDTPFKMMDDISISFTDSVGIISASWSDTAISLKTINGGENWNGIMQAVTGGVNFSIVNENVIYSVFSNKQFKSSNGGLSWNFIRNLPFSVQGENSFKVFNALGAGYASCGYATSFVTFFNDSVDTFKEYGWYTPSSFCFVDSLNGYFLQNKNLYRTTDRCVSYSSINNFSDNMRHLFYLDNNLGFVCGDSGIIYKTTTGGSTSLNNPQLQKKLKIYPNPTNESLNIEYGNDMQIQSIQLVDVSGKVFQSFNKNDKVLSMGSVASGVYFLNIKTKEGNITEQVIVD